MDGRRPLPSRLGCDSPQQGTKGKKKTATNWEEKLLHNADIHVTGKKDSLLLLLLCHELRLNIVMMGQHEDHGGVQTSGQ